MRFMCCITSEGLSRDVSSYPNCLVANCQGDQGEGGGRGTDYMVVMPSVALHIPDVLVIQLLTLLIYVSVHDNRELSFVVEYSVQKPSARLAPKKLSSAKAGSNVTLKCLVKGRPFPSISWYKSDQLLTSENSEHLVIKR